MEENKNRTERTESYEKMTAKELFIDVWIKVLNVLLKSQENIIWSC